VTEALTKWWPTALISLLTALLGAGGTYVATNANASPESKTASPQVAVTISAAELRKLAGCRPAREGNAYGTTVK